jgi:hypothetical protein
MATSAGLTAEVVAGRISASGRTAAVRGESPTSVAAAQAAQLSGLCE